MHAESFSCVQLFVSLWTVAHKAPLSMGFSRQEYQSGLPCPSPADLSDPGIEPPSLESPALACGFFTSSVIGKPKLELTQCQFLSILLVCS